MSTTILPRAGILSYMDDEDRDDLCQYGTQVGTTPGQVLTQEGQPQTRLHIVLSGTCSIFTQAGGGEVQLDTIKAGDCFGEIAIFQPGMASATVTVTEPGLVWFMESEHLQQFLTNSPFAGCALLLGVNTILSRRLIRANSVIKSNQIVPAFLSIRNRGRAGAAAKP